MRELAATVVLLNDVRLQVKRKEHKGQTSYYFAMDNTMALITADELEDVMSSIAQVLYCGKGG